MAHNAKKLSLSPSMCARRRPTMLRCSSPSASSPMVLTRCPAERRCFARLRVVPSEFVSHGASARGHIDREMVQRANSKRLQQVIGEGVMELTCAPGRRIPWAARSTIMGRWGTCQSSAWRGGIQSSGICAASNRCFGGSRNPRGTWQHQNSRTRTLRHNHGCTNHCFWVSTWKRGAEGLSCRRETVCDPCLALTAKANALACSVSCAEPSYPLIAHPCTWPSR